MSDELLIRHCAPTLAGLKTANMFSCTFEDRGDMVTNVRRLNLALGKKGVRILPLRFRDNEGLIYVYRPERLTADLRQEEADCLLSERGYLCSTVGKYIAHLIHGLREQKEFPHEIGLFLGYPPEDVSGFIKHGAKESKCHDYWKVYGDEEKAKKIFSMYHRCTRDYFRRWHEGSTLEQLTVNI